jgi:hypothetical protein
MKTTPSDVSDVPAHNFSIRVRARLMESYVELCQMCQADQNKD